jgi:hypothetical protein
MGLDEVVVEVGPGTAIRVGQRVMRTWRCLPDSDDNLRWLCIRGDGGALPRLPDDSTRIDGPMPW